MYGAFPCLRIMKQRNDTGDESNPELPFSFRKENISSKKVMEHWAKIALKMAVEKPSFGQEKKSKL
ncbi:hypothetical protein LPB86_05250 [Pedobacter sp. MC2016-14]|uniref:hypothetical protein n=1 Tax=Pedobacter sp. MC2016-14 TaxID=2897327 RepID=UPI001E4B9E00|nr:hypothetical protein [Pedobacter sp. MC2016-14]MCD0487623.1 hypothetical protein [Pedobacter sp. MC2016-14]